MKGLVVKKNADHFLVRFGQNEFNCTARGNLKQKGVYVGDKVEFSKSDLVITDIQERKNLLVRPPIANLDTLIIVIAPKPKPDLYLVDKLIIFSTLNGITPILCLNKVDQDPLFAKNIKKIYGNILKIVETSAFNKNTSELEKCVKGVCAFAGQSAVGKSSLINAIFDENKEKIGDFGKKVERGKQTTRLVTLYKLKDGFLADTAGFSKLDERLLNLEPIEIARYYPEMIKFIPNCKFRTCTHKNSDNCAVIKAVKEGIISEVRYNNYLKLLENKMLERRKY